MLNEDNERIYKYVQETEGLWNSLCKINSNCQESNSLYSEYQREIRNNDHLANQIQGKLISDARKRAITVLMKHNETLFDSKTAVIHIASSKGAVGKVTKTNKAITEVFGYNQMEFIENSINKIMPNAVAKKHSEFMEIYFRTGRDRVLNRERSTFALHKKGYCFPIKLFVRPMPQLNNGYLQFVGMILSQQDDYEYIITDSKGNIDSVSRRLAVKFQIKPKMFHKLRPIAVQAIAPELIYSYQDEYKQTAKGKKFKEAGGDELLFIIPNNLREIVENTRCSSKKVVTRGTDKSFDHVFNTLVSEKVTPADIYKNDEYTSSTLRFKVKCKIQDMTFGSLRGGVKVDIRLLRISGIKVNDSGNNEANPPIEVIGAESPSSASPRKKMNEEEKVSKIITESDDFDEEMILPNPANNPPEDSSQAHEQMGSFRLLIDKFSDMKANKVEEKKETKINLNTKKISRKLKVDTLKQEPSNTMTAISLSSDRKNANYNHEGISKSIRRARIIDLYDSEGNTLNKIEIYKEGQEEQELKRNFLKFQLIEKRNRERLANAMNSTEMVEVEEEKMEETVDKEAEEEASKEENGGDNESITSTSTGATLRATYSIRAAIDEKHIPDSIRNINFMTIFMFVLLLALAIGYFVLEIKSYSNMNKLVKDVRYSEDRKFALIEINLNLKALLLLDSRFKESVYSRYYLDFNARNNASLIRHLNDSVRVAALKLKEAQTELSIEIKDIKSLQHKRINPSNINVTFLDMNNSMPKYYIYTIWQAMLEAVVGSLRISNTIYDHSISNYSGIHLLNTNSLNSFLVALDDSTDGLMDNINDSSNHNMKIDMILLIIASAAVAIFIVVLIPVLRSAKKTKDEVLLLFLLLEESEIKAYQKKCERFASSRKNVLSCYKDLD